MSLPYDGYDIQEWDIVTERLITAHPLAEKDIVNSVLEAWDKIMLTKVGGELQIGVDIFPIPQIMGEFLHELIPITLAKRYPNIFRKGLTKAEKDVVCIPNNNLSLEIKTSSDGTSLYGNRSYGQESSGNNSSKKKYGYLQ